MTTGATDAGFFEAAEPLDAIEYCYERGWTDGLPVIPCTQGLLDEFLSQTDRDPDDVVFAMPQLNRSCTVRLAALNAAMSGCRPEYFPVVLAVWTSLREEGYAAKGIWQSTTGTAPFIVVNGPVRDQIGINSQGNVFGSGFRANATIGRALRLTAINVFGIKPRELDQATQGTPAKYTCCIGENEEESPWPPLHHEFGFALGESTATVMMIRSAIQIEARHTALPQQLLRDVAGTIARTGALLHQTISSCLVLSPEHAHLLAAQGWDKPRIKRFLFEEASLTKSQLDRVGKGAISRQSRWRVPMEHADAMVDDRIDENDGILRVLTSPDAVQVLVAGASNSGVSSVIDTFGPRGNRPAIAQVQERIQ